MSIVQGHNDYVLIITNYLLNYVAFTDYVKDMEMRIDDITWMLDEEPVPKVPALSGAGGCGGGDGTSPQESEYLRHEQLKDERKRLQQNVKDIKTRMDRLAKCFHELDETDQKILEIYYINGAKSWAELDNVVRSAMKEAELFIKGKRAQMTLDIEAETPAQKLKGGVA